MKLGWSLRVVVLLPLLAACGPEPGPGSGTSPVGDASTGDESENATVGASDAQESTGAAEGGGDSSGGPDDECAPMTGVSEDPLPPGVSCEALAGKADTEAGVVEVHLVNDTVSSIVVPAHALPPERRWFDLDGYADGHHGATPYSPCPDFWDESHCGVYTGDPPSCRLGPVLPSVPAIRIAPGGTFVQTWDAWLPMTAVVPPECSVDETDHPCLAPVPVVLGVYLATSQAWWLSECEGDCSCTPNVDGWCELLDVTLPDRPRLTATTHWNGACDSIALEFGG